MSEKVYNWIAGIITGVEAIAIATVTYFNPAMAEAINAAIVIGCGAIKEICKKFVKD